MNRIVLSLSICIGIASSPVLGQEEPSSIEGYWQGAVVRDAGGVLPIELRLSRVNGTLQAAFEVPSCGWILPSQPATYDPPNIDLPFGRDRLRLEVDADSGSMRGRLVSRQPNPGAPPVIAELTRTIEPPAPPVESREVTFESADGVTIAGTMLLPADGKGLPGIVFVQGRSYGSRAQFHFHARLAARRGMAAIIFDGRGVGGTGGIRGQHTLANRLDDAEAALKTLRAHPRVDASRVGMFGHSAGGWVIPVVGRRVDPLAFLVLHSGPAENLAEQQAHVVGELMKMSDTEFTEDEIQKAYDYQKRLVEMCAEGATWEEIQKLVAGADGQRWAETADIPKSYEDSQLDYFRRNPHDSVQALRETKTPLLAIFGAEDFVVPPELNVPRLEQLMKEAGNEDWKAVVFPEADHDLMIESKDGPPHRWMRVPPGYFETWLDWVQERAKPGAH
ncbi:MAG: alpha/beta fold hydrolase [Planctomycetota bacterium]